jgi:subtilisin-like proprotein convertase family protein
MKNQLFAVGLMVALAGGAEASVDYYNGTGAWITDGSKAGITQTIISTDAGTINNVSVLLNISGGYNGDLYGYLVYNDGSSTKTEVLLDRIGGGNSAASGSGFGTGAATSSFSELQSYGIRLVDGAGSGIATVSPGSGQFVAVGDYTPDSATTFASTFSGMNASGTWTLFLSDLSAGDQSRLVSWGLSLDVNPIPEPTTWAAIIFGAMFTSAQIVRKRRMATRRRNIPG